MSVSATIGDLREGRPCLCDYRAAVSRAIHFTHPARADVIEDICKVRSLVPGVIFSNP